MTEDDCIYEGALQAGCRDGEPKCLPCAKRRIALRDSEIKFLREVELQKDEENRSLKVTVVTMVKLEQEIDALKKRLHDQHVVVRELAAFTEGVMLSEFVNAHDTTAYSLGAVRVGSFVEISRQIAAQEA